jgi:hypothetical protein
MDQKLKDHLLSKDTWIRVVFMILCGIANYILQFVLWLIAIIQLISTLATGKPNHKLLSFTSGLSTFSYQMVKFLLYNSEEKPYPFSAWPKG